MALKRPKTAEVEPFGQEVARRIALAGAVAVVDLGDASSWKTWKFGNKDWQIEAWRLYDVIGELHKLAGRIGDSVSQARLYVTEVSETGEETGEVTDEAIKRLAAVPLGTGHHRDGNLRLAGIDLAVGGECWIVGEGAAQSPELAEGSWFVVTAAALGREGGVGAVTVKRPQTRGGSRLTLRDGVDILIRCWREHPNDTDQADSFTRSAIVPLREIELLTKREFAELDSRLTGAGIMFVPEGIDFPRLESDPAGLAGFMAYLQRAAATSMQDQSSAKAMVPIMATVPDEMIEHLDKIKPLNFWSDLSAEISPMKKEAIERVASMAEIPAEVLTGIGNANHWTAWLISDEGIRWIKGYLGLVAEALTRGFLRLALASMKVPNPERYAFTFDTSTLASKPNRLDDAAKLHEMGLISDEDMVKAAAFSIEQMPNEAQRAKQIIYRLVMIQPDLALDPEVQKILGLPPIKSVGLPPTADQNADGGTDDEDGGSDDGPPNDGEDPDAPSDGKDRARAITAALDDRILELTATRTAAPVSPELVFNASAKLMVMRALELAGGRLTTPQERRGRWAEVPRHELHHHVGPITPEKALRVTEGAWNHVALVADDLGVNADDLGALLGGYVHELLTRGIRHHDDLLFAALSVANRGRGVAVLDAQGVETFHLPGRHDQKNHGNRRGRPNNVPGKTGIGRTVKEDERRVKAEDERATKAEAREAKMRAALGDKLNVSDEGTSIVKRHLRHLSQIPVGLHAAMKSYLDQTDLNSGVFVSAKAVPYMTPESAALRDLRPRGWPPGKTWNDVHGAFSPVNRQVMIGDGPNRREGGDHQSTARHEYGHAIQDVFRSRATFGDRATQAEAIENLGRIRHMNPYFSSVGNPSGYQSELFAEMFSFWSGGYPIPVIRAGLGMAPDVGQGNDDIQTILDMFDNTFGEITR